MPDELAEKVAAGGSDGAFDKRTEKVVGLMTRIEPLGIIDRGDAVCHADPFPLGMIRKRTGSLAPDAKSPQRMVAGPRFLYQV